MASKRSRRLSGKVKSGEDMIANSTFEDQENDGGFGVNNDDEERKQRRRSVKRNRRRSARFSLGGKGIRKTNAGEELSVLTEGQLTSMYKATIQMSTQNKITSKNAFQLQLIDRINQVVDVVTGNGDSGANENAFQHAGCVVEAAAKIYDARVEETYQNTQRFVSDLARSNKSKEDNEQEEDAETSETNTAEAAKAKRSKKLCGGKTLETNLESLVICKEDLECDVNPLFEKMSQKFDEGGARGLLLGNVPISNGPKIIIGGNSTTTTTTTAFVEKGGKDKQQQQQQQEEATMMFTLQMDTSAMCKAASASRLCSDTHCFYSWYDMYAGNDAATHGGGGASSSDDCSGVASDGSARHLEQSGMNMDDEDDDEDDYAGGDMYDNFGGDDDFGDDFGLCDDNGREGGREENPNQPSVAIGASASAYSYYEMPNPTQSTASWTNKKSNWAGQGHNKHWKLFDGASSSSNLSNSSSEGGKKKKSVKEIFVFDFGAEPIDVTTAFATSRAATTQSQKVQDASNLKSYLLPDDAHYDMKDLQRLFFRPTAFVRASSGGEGSTSFGDMTNGEGGDDWGGDDWGGDEGGMAFGEDASTSVFSAPHSNDDLDLVEDANLTEKIDIGYATTRKVFDIKQLKNEFWSHLSEAAPVKPDCKQVFENVEEESHDVCEQNIATVFEGAATFTGTLDKVCFIFFLTSSPPRLPSLH